MTKRYYTNEQLADAVENSSSFLEVARRLGLKDGGGSQAYLKKLIQELGLDISHFSRKTPSPPPRIDEILTACKSDRRTINLLVKAGAKSGACEYSGKKIHAGLPIQLVIIYNDKNPLNRSPENIRLLCPNCIVLGKHA